MTKIHASIISVSVKSDDGNGTTYRDLQDVLKKYEEFFFSMKERIEQLEHAYIEQQLLYKKEE